MTVRTRHFQESQAVDKFLNSFRLAVCLVFTVHLHPGCRNLSPIFRKRMKTKRKIGSEIATSQILPTVTNDFLFHFLLVTVGKIEDEGE